VGVGDAVGIATIEDFLEVSVCVSLSLARARARALSFRWPDRHNHTLTHLPTLSGARAIARSLSLSFSQEILGEEIVDETDVYIDNRPHRPDSKPLSISSKQSSISFSLPEGPSNR
jgi:hypothetical protein